MPTYLTRSLSWSPTVALSWLWGLGFFYAIHVTLTYGWLGFVAFAVPNAAGLFLFGWVLGAPRRDPAAILRAVEGSYAGLFLIAQLFATAVTIFGFVAYLWLPLVGGNVIFGVGLLVLLACALGHALPLRSLKTLHVAYLGVGLAAALYALWGLRLTFEAPATPLAQFDARFFGLVLPSLVGFLLGPWTDVQQWQRAVEIRRDGGSVRMAYGFGSLLFAGLLTVNALLAAAAGAAGTVVAADGIAGAQPAVALAIVRHAPEGVAVGFLVWGAIAALSTLDSAYAAIRWFMLSLTQRSVSPILAFVPPGLVSSPFWVFLAAAGIAFAMVSANLSLMYLMLPFATLLVGGAACLVCEALGVRRRYDPVLCYMIGLAAGLIFLAGYVAAVPAFLALAPLLALVGALPMILSKVRGGREAAPLPATQAILAADAAQEAAPRVAILTRAGEDAAASHGFDGQWFVLRLLPTYDDTNSVGNIYFANYVRWVGKARELFFNICMPKFDLSQTQYYVLTRSFTHDFRREAREFEPITVRIRIARHNRKFVTLEHEIHSDTHGLLGRGEQSLMFVDTGQYRPLDIPRDIIVGFLPYWPKESPHVAAVSTPANDGVRRTLAS